MEFAGLFRFHHAEPNVLFNFVVVAALWHGPIRRFHLVVRKPSAESVLSTCFDGALTKINATDFEFTATDYTPRGDILIGVVR